MKAFDSDDAACRCDVVHLLESWRGLENVHEAAKSPSYY